MLGSNTGDRKGILDRAVECLGSCICVTGITPDFDNPDYTRRGNDYLNRLVSGVTDMPLEALREALRDIEERLGRDRSTSGRVTADIDVVVYGGSVVKQAEYDSDPFRQLSGLLSEIKKPDIHH